MPQTSAKNDLVIVMKECWNEDPKLRPHFQTLMRTIRKLSGYVQYEELLAPFNQTQDCIQELHVVVCPACPALATVGAYWYIVSL